MRQSGDQFGAVAPGAVLDYVGIGFGPSNLALAIAASEQPIPLHGLFFESKRCLQWHPGMLLEGSRLQVSFIKDLVTLRNPASPFTFLQYLKAKGRLERFANLREFYPTRVEYQDYLQWAAEAFADRVAYGTRVRSVGVAACEHDPRVWLFSVEVENAADGGRATYLARNVIWAAGGRPNLLGFDADASSAIVHSSDFLRRFGERFGDGGARHDFAVAGAGQSAGEIVRYLHANYPSSRIQFIIPHYALRPSDDTPFVNEIFFSEETDWFYGLDDDERARLRAETRNTNYGVLDDDLIHELYRTCYADEVAGAPRLRIRRFSRVSSAVEADGRVRIVVKDELRDHYETETCDALVLATGYTRDFDDALFADLLPYLRRTPGGRVMVSRRYRAELRLPMDGGLYVQGCGEESHGMGDTLLSLLPFRSAEIVSEICSDALDQTRVGSGAVAAGGVRGSR